MKFEVREPVRVVEQHQVWIYVEAGKDLVPQTIWAPTRGTRRQKIVPECIDVRWERTNEDMWRMKHLFLHGSNRFHAYHSVTLVDGPRSDTATETWVVKALMPYAPQEWAEL